ncbi:MAG TPA: SH3 domain-containing protein, partial [Candidatus Limnocylindrales bacterium]|nr:SH3 domain-containing protein [Candidatus Limnocylindrales bacterium]
GSDTRGSRGGTGGSHPGSWGPIAALFALAGLPAPTFPSFGLAPTLVTTTGAVTAAMAFGLFGRRRRDDDDLSDDALAAAAARGLEVAPAALAAIATADRLADGAEIDGAAADGIGPPFAADLEALMPRWRRPSLLQARKADPIRDDTPAPRLTFDQGLVGKLDGRERRIIRYRLVRLLDSPDELRGGEIGYLDQGDEVQLLEKYGAYWLVLCPDGRQGWVPKMTLGELIDDGPAEGPVATMPTIAETWTMGEADDDSDVFAAYLESQRRRRES